MDVMNLMIFNRVYQLLHNFSQLCNAPLHYLLGQMALPWLDHTDWFMEESANKQTLSVLKICLVAKTALLFST